MRSPSFILLLLCSTLAGCIVHPAANTQLTLTPASQPHPTPLTLGMEEVCWTQLNGTAPVDVYGYGWHPREHELYCFFWVEADPALDPRWLHIRSTDSGAARLTIMLSRRTLQQLQLPPETNGDPMLFVGDIEHLPSPTFSNLTIRLKHVKLTTPDGRNSLWLSGCIVARHTVPDDLPAPITNLPPALLQN